jgi:hypothetical protein
MNGSVVPARLPGLALSVLIALAAAPTAEAQGPDLVLVTFNRAFGRAPLVEPTQLDTSLHLDSVIAAGRAAAELPTDLARRDAFVRHLDGALGQTLDRSSMKLLFAILGASLDDLTDDRAYLHARLAEVKDAAEALGDQMKELEDASRRVASPAFMRGVNTVPVSIVNVDARLFENVDAADRRTRSCEPCYTRRLSRLTATDVGREMQNATVLQLRVQARQEELLGRGADFNRRALAVVALFADALQQLDQRKGGSIRAALP